MTGTQTTNPTGTTQLPCDCVVPTKPGELGRCLGTCQGDPR